MFIQYLYHSSTVISAWALNRLCLSSYFASASRFFASGSVRKCFPRRVPSFVRNLAAYLPSFLWQIPAPHSLPLRLLPIVEASFLFRKGPNTIPNIPRGSSFLKVFRRILPSFLPVISYRHLRADVFFKFLPLVRTNSAPICHRFSCFFWELSFCGNIVATKLTFSLLVLY